MSDVALIILAAGESSRLGEAKQLREFKGKTLLANVVDLGLESRCTEIVLVLGSQIERMKEAISNRNIEIVENANWKEGMASSIVAGISHLNKSDKAIEAAIIATCDQIFLSVEILNSLISTFENSKCEIVASKYNEIAGVPALFSKTLFTDLLKLSGTEGARKIIRTHERPIATIDFPKGSFDLDTEKDWQSLLEQS